MKIYSYLALIIFSALTLIPPVDFFITNPQGEYWLWMVIIAGFFGFFTIFIKTDWPVRVIAIAGFVNCFFSAAPYISFTSYVSLVGCCYFYIICSKIKDWDIIFKALQTIVILNVFLMFMQFIGKDTLMNFGLFHVEHYGTIGQHMQMGSLAVILSAILVIYNKYFIILPFLTALFCHSNWTFMAAGVGVVVYLYHLNANLSSIILVFFLSIFIIGSIQDHKVMENLDSTSGRAGCWQKAIELSNQRPLTGWGIGTFKDLFHPLSGMTCTPWRTAHNFVIELLFEVGYPLTICLLFALGWLFWTLLISGLWLPLAGLSMMVIDGLMHFPDRMIQTVPIIVIFFAFCGFNLRRYA